MINRLKNSIGHPISLVVIIWLVFALEFILPGNLNQWGIHPRSIPGLLGILFSPFLHANLFHIVSNSLPLLILGCFVVMSSSVTRFWLITTIIIIVGGFGTWVFSSAGVVIGASGLVFGYWSFLLAYAYFKRSIIAIIAGLVTLILYSGMFFSLLAFKPYISFAGHLFGAVAGVVAAYLLVNYKVDDE